MSPISNLPKWKGADRVYSYLYRVLEKMGLENWQAELATSKKRRRKIKKSPAPTEDMVMIIKALNKGDEESLKGIQMHYKTVRYLTVKR